MPRNTLSKLAAATPMVENRAKSIVRFLCRGETALNRRSMLSGLPHGALGLQSGGGWGGDEQAYRSDEKPLWVSLIEVHLSKGETH